jgi:dihydrofolate reductase
VRGGKRVVLIAAVGENGVIGRQGALPWRLKSDLQHFKSLTLNRPVIMGRKTYDSIGKPLKDRTNIVLTRDHNMATPGTVPANSLDGAFDIASKDADKRGADEIMVIGGADVFAATMADADRLEITRVHASPAGETFFPPIDLQVWRESRREPHVRGPDDEADFTILTYERRA